MLHPKVSSSVVAGAIVSIVMGELSRRGITLSPDEAAGFTALIALVAGFFTPSNDEPDQPAIPNPVSAPPPVAPPPPASLSSTILGGAPTPNA